MDIVYRHIEFVTWILSIVTSLLSIVTLLLSIVTSMLSHVHHRIAQPLGPPYNYIIYATAYAPYGVHPLCTINQQPTCLIRSHRTLQAHFSQPVQQFDNLLTYYKLLLIGYPQTKLLIPYQSGKIGYM